MIIENLHFINNYDCNIYVDFSTLKDITPNIQGSSM